MCFRPPTLDLGAVTCPKCGAEVPTDAAQCPKCGAREESAAPARAAVPSIPKPGVIPAPPKAPGAPNK